jgi:hypothetical protein
LNNVDDIPETINSLGQAEEDTDIGTSTFGNGEQEYDNDKDLTFFCLNNNNNKRPTPIVEEGATISINKEWFVCNNNDPINCIIEPQEEGEQISFEDPNSGLYTQCTSDQDCPFANDAGFNIEITGNSPTPNTIPAQVNTVQQVEIGAGPFEVSEELFSDRFVPNANFEVQNVLLDKIFHLLFLL